jgi:hypothetical protein
MCSWWLWVRRSDKKCTGGLSDHHTRRKRRDSYLQTDVLMAAAIHASIGMIGNDVATAIFLLAAYYGE